MQQGSLDKPLYAPIELVFELALVNIYLNICNPQHRSGIVAHLSSDYPIA